MNSRTAAPIVAAALLSAACAGRPIPPTGADPRAFGGRPWKSTLGRSDRLVGYALSTRDERWVGAEELLAAVAKADFVFLGETHDDPDHHLLQADFLKAALAGGRKPALAFEMLDASQAGPLEQALAQKPVTPDAIAEATGWAKSGWPEFDFYRPIFEVGVEAGLPIVAANLPRSAAREAVRKGSSALPDDVRDLLGRAGAPTAAELKSWAAEMEESHCGELDPSMLEGLVLAQRARDAQMALRLASAGAEGRGAVLVTGNGHARADRGVPAWVERIRPGASQVSIGLLEVDPDLRWPRQYAEEFGADRFPFDYVVFTPRTEREDPCEQLRARKKKASAAQR